MTIAFQEKCPVFSVSSSNKPAAASSSRNSSPYSTQNTTPTPYPTTDQNTPYPQANSAPYPQTNHMTPYPTSHPIGGIPIPSAMPYSAPMPNVNAPYPSYQPSGYQPPYMNMPGTQPSSAATSMPYGTGTIQSSHIRASLMTAIEERLRQMLRDQLGNFWANDEDKCSSFRKKSCHPNI